MHFDFDDDQYNYRDAVRDALKLKMSPEHLRKAWAESHEYESQIWPTLVDLGLTGILVSEAHGGAGASLVDLTLVLEECGYFAVPEPIVETLVLAPLALSRWGSDALRATWLPLLAAGSVVAAAQLGKSSIVSDGIRADVTLVWTGSQLHWVPKEAVRPTAVAGIDPSRRLAHCKFDLDDSTLLSDDPAALAQLHDLGAAATASLLVGIATRLTEMTRQYVLERQQFGRQIGSFQALKHRLADVAVQTEAARSLSWYAAYALSRDLPDASIAASLAKGAANKAAFMANYASLQLHGGIGFTWEFDLHLWLQRGKALEGTFGSTSEHQERVGAYVLDGSAA